MKASLLGTSVFYACLSILMWPGVSGEGLGFLVALHSVLLFFPLSGILGLFGVVAFVRQLEAPASQRSSQTRTTSLVLLAAGILLQLGFTAAWLLDGRDFFLAATLGATTLTAAGLGFAWSAAR